MADKVQLIKEEIEKRLSNLWHLIPEGEKVLQDNFTKEDANNLGKYTALESILRFIDSLSEEPASEDLEEEIDNYFKDWTFDDEMSVMVKPNHYFAEFNDIKEIARHFAEWQNQQMMKDAVDAIIFSELKDSDGSLFQAKSDRFRMNGVKISDKIKVIPIKTEQQ